VHAQYNRNTDLIDVVNRTYNTYSAITIEAELFDVNGKSLLKASEKLKLLPSSSIPWKSMAQWKKNAGVQFLLLRVRDAQSKLLSANTYWLENANDFTSLNTMPKATVAASVITDNIREDKRMITVQLQNDSKQLAFFTRMQLLDARGEEVLPAYWSDNYITLKAGEKQLVNVWIDLESTTPTSVRVYGWNAEEVVVNLR
jgi:exo-1,4-beta-D-glucosaminidase